MLDESSTKRFSQKEETYFSKWIEESQVDDFRKTMQPTIDKFEKLEEEGYRVEVDIQNRFDSDCFGDKDVVIVMIDLKASKHY